MNLPLSPATARLSRAACRLVIALLAGIACAACTAKGNLPLTVRKQFDLGTPGAAVAVGWSPDGSRLAAASNYGSDLSVWDSAGRQLQHINRAGEGPALGGSIAFGPDGTQLLFPPPRGASNDVALSVWDIGTGQIVKTIQGPEPGKLSGFNRGEKFTLSPDGRYLALATVIGGARPGYQSNLAIYDAHSWQLLRRYKIVSGVSSLAFFDGGRGLIAGSDAGRVFVIDLAADVAPREFQGYKPSDLGSFSVGGVAGSPNGAVGLGAIGLGRISGSQATAGNAWAESLDPAWIFRVSDGARLATLRPVTVPVRGAAWDPKGRYVALIGNARDLVLWQPAAPWTRYDTITLPSKTFALAISPDGGHIAVTTDNGVTVYSVK